MPRSRRRGAIGANVPRIDGPAKVAGQAAFPQDLPVPAGCLHVATVRAPVAAGQLKHLELNAALATPGVVRIITAADVRGTNRFGLKEPDQPVLVERTIHGASDVVALVVASTERAAREGARRMIVDVAPARLLLDPERACDPDAPVVQPSRAVTTAHPNLLAERRLRRGATVRALAQSAIVIAGEYRAGQVDHAFLAPEAGIAAPDGAGGFVLEVATQWPEEDLRQAARALGLPVEGLRIVQAEIGGAFGGREDVSLQILLLLAAQVTGGPVRMVWSRAESVRGHGKRHSFRIRHRLGADRRGRLTAARIEILLDAGCYASTSSQLLDNALAQATGPYRIPATLIEGRVVLTHNPFSCAFRGFGVNEVAFAMEQQIAKLAAALACDPVALRFQNLIRGRATLGSGSTASVGSGPRTTLEAARDRASRRRLPPSSGAVRSGRGIAIALKNFGFGFGADDHATAEVRLGPAGAVIRIGAAEVGQGASTILTQIAAATLGLSLSQVTVEWRDTGTAPEAGSVSASRTTVFAGAAVELACRRASRGGLVRLPPTGERIYRATYRGTPTARLGRGEPARHMVGYGWGASIADVTVDVETGLVIVHRVVAAVDAGRVINPALLRGQVEGGVVMGQGYALQERCRMEDGLPVSLGFGRCGVPTSLDAVPRIETVAVEFPHRGTALGVRGIGEITMIPVTPAITAAIYDACGVWIDELPATPERVRAAIATLNTALGRQIPQ